MHPPAALNRLTGCRDDKGSEADDDGAVFLGQDNFAYKSVGNYWTLGYQDNPSGPGSGSSSDRTYTLPPPNSTYSVHSYCLEDCSAAGALGSLIWNNKGDGNDDASLSVYQSGKGAFYYGATVAQSNFNTQNPQNCIRRKCMFNLQLAALIAGVVTYDYSKINDHPMDTILGGTQVQFQGLDYSASSTGTPISDIPTMQSLLSASGFDGTLLDFFPNNLTHKASVEGTITVSTVLDTQIQCLCVNTPETPCPSLLKITWKNANGVSIAGEDLNSTYAPDHSPSTAPTASATLQADEESAAAASAGTSTKPASSIPQLRLAPISERYILKRLPAGSKRYVINSKHLKTIGTRTVCRKKPLVCPKGRKTCFSRCR
eukprot:gene4978-5220_t